MLIILIAACRSARTAFEADGVVDPELATDLSRLIERAEGELGRLSRQIESNA